jgi:thiamine-monophosphate kinase
VFEGLVISHDTIVEGVHYRADDPPETVGWKLAGVNASDLAAKGAVPAVAILSLTMRGDGVWEKAFLDGLAEAMEEFGLALVGGDTTALPAHAPRVLGLTVIGRAGSRVPSRADGTPGETLWTVGRIGDAAAGLAQLDDNPKASGPLVQAYRQPWPQLAPGRAVVAHVGAMMDVSDGLLIDAARLAAASGCGGEIELDAVPLSDAFVSARGEDRVARLFAATGGDDYALLFSSSAPEAVLRHSLPVGPTLTAIGRLVPGEGLALTHDGERVPVPEHLGYEHRGT